MAEKRRRREQPSAAAPKTSTRAKARVGKKAIVGYYAPEISEQLRSVAEGEGRTMQAALGDALNMLFDSRGMKTFDPE